MQEEWKNINGFEGYYQISNFGRVKSVERVVKRKDGTIMKVSEKLGNFSTQQIIIHMLFCLKMENIKLFQCTDQLQKTF